ncbi:LLM class flavin-dependent oxidoreductase [Nocardia sp. NPDC002869]|uniref:LLM class flavin-dependent oxidoreductase n=1 Tax=Nocardia sp. NPDC002869 TaxID=3161032 RepID=UPI00398C95DD
MRLGAFLINSHPPERSIHDGHQEDLAQIMFLEQAGVDEVWIGEHYTARWSPCPAPDLLIAQALMITNRIRLGPLGHLLPYHHPVELAHRAAYLDHLSGGRYQFGAAISALPTDRQLFAIDHRPGLNRDMTFEALDIIDRLWTEGPTEFRGMFWNTGSPDSPLPALDYFLRPLQRPRPPIAMAGMTAGSANLRLAGARGYLPVSLAITPDGRQLARQFDTVADGAAAAGRIADRGRWRIVQDIVVAPTDSEARELARHGAMARCWSEFLLPLYLHLGLGPLLGALPDGTVVPDDEIDLDYLLEHLWLVGSPRTVAGKIDELTRATGGFGTLLLTCYDTAEERETWQRSVRLLTTEVLPQCLESDTGAPGSAATITQRPATAGRRADGTA